VGRGSARLGGIDIQRFTNAGLFADEDCPSVRVHRVRSVEQVYDLYPSLRA